MQRARPGILTLPSCSQVLALAMTAFAIRSRAGSSACASATASERCSLIISQHCAGESVTSSTATSHPATSTSPAAWYRALTYPGAAHRNMPGPCGPGGAGTASASAAMACRAIAAHGFSPGPAHTDEYSRPPGLSTRANSAVALARSGKNMYPNRTEMLSNAASPNGRSSALHTLVSKLAIPSASARRAAMPSISAERSVSTTCAPGASLATVSPGSQVSPTSRQPLRTPDLARPGVSARATSPVPGRFWRRLDDGPAGRTAPGQGVTVIVTVWTVPPLPPAIG